MPLTQAKSIGYDLVRMMFRFTMQTSDKRTVLHAKSAAWQWTPSRA